MITRRRFLEASAVLGLANTAAQTAAMASASGGVAGSTASTTSPVNSGASRYEAALGSKLNYKGSRLYEILRKGTIWNGRKPARFPPAVVMAENENDVIAAVKLARVRGWKVGVASGGHSFTSSFLRDDALLINLSRLEQFDVHADKQTVSISPSMTGNVLGADLAEAGFMTPTAHGVAVGMGGFVLCGGHGWMSRAWGPACANLKSLDVVTADGELIHCDENTNTDYYWAARGGGPGFFGAAVRYEMKIYPRPTVMRSTVHTFQADDIGDALVWIRDNLMSFPSLLETAVVGKQRDGKPVLKVIGSAAGYNEKEVADALAVYDRYPNIEKATHQRNFEDPLPHMAEKSDESNPAGWPQVVDGMWTTAPSSVLVPAALPYFLNHPTARSDVYWSCWGPIQKLPDMAYSIQGNVYMSINCPYDDGQDDRYLSYVADAFRKLEPLAVGSQMNDENMWGRSSARYLSDASAARLEALRAKYDPERRFAGFLRS